MSGGPTSDTSLRRRIDDLTARMRVLENQLRQQGASRLASIGRHRDVRLAVTTSSDDFPYPDAPANKFPITFIDDHFTEEPGDEDSNAFNRSEEPEVVAKCKLGRYLPEGTEVAVLEQRGLDDTATGRYWIIEADLVRSLFAKTGSEGVPGRVGDTAGKATDHQLYYIDGDDELVLIELAEGEENEAIYNISSAAVSPDTFIKVGREDESGRLTVEVESCNDPV